MDAATGLLNPSLAVLPYSPAQTETVLPSRHLENFAFRFGRSYDSYLAADPGRLRFWSKNGRGVVAYVRLGKYLNVVGGLLAETKDQEALLSEFVDYAQRRNLFISFYNIAPAELPLFRRCGFQVTKWGEDAWIDLPKETWKGKAYEWVRRQSNYCQRHGVDFSECFPQQLSAGAWNQIAQQLEEISADRLATRPQVTEMSFLDGRFFASGLGRRRLFLARSAERIEGFLICNPCLNGTEWALDVYRQRADGPRGTIPFLVHQTLQQLKDEGIERASLCLIPSLRCRAMPNDSRLIRWGLNLGRKFPFIFDSAGLYHFKSRFRPQFDDRYVCVYPKATLGSVRAFTRLCGVLDLSPRKMLAGIWRRLTKYHCRSTLAKPHADAE